MPDIELGISLDTSKTLKNLVNLTKKTDKFGKESVKSFSGATKAFDVFKGALAADVTLRAFDAITAAAGRLFDVFITQGITAAEGNEQAVTELNAALVRNGEFSKEATEGIIEFTDALEQSTATDGDAIVRLIALAQAFGFSAEQSKVAAEAAIELSVAAGIALEEALRRVGRTISGSIADVSKFAPEIKKLTKAQLEAGDAATILADKLRGTAAASLNTFAGQLKLLQLNFGGVQEEFGKAIIQNPVVIQQIGRLSTAVVELNKSITSGEIDLKGFVNTLIDGVAVGAGIAVSSVVSLVDVFNSIQNVVDKVRDGFSGLSFSFAKTSLAINNLILTTQLSFNANEKLLNQTQARLNRSQAIIDSLTKEGLAAAAATATRNQANQELLNSEEEIQKRIAEFRALDVENLKQTQAQLELLNLERSEKNKEQQALSDEEKLTRAEQEFVDLQKRNDVLLALDEEKFAAEIEANKRKQDKILKDTGINSQKVMSIKQKENEIFSKLDQQRLAAVGAFFGGLASISAFGGKQNFEIAKRAAQAEAIIAGALAFSKALASAPPPLLGQYSLQVLLLKQLLKLERLRGLLYKLVLIRFLELEQQTTFLLFWLLVRGLFLQKPIKI